MRNTFRVLCLAAVSIIISTSITAESSLGAGPGVEARQGSAGNGRFNQPSWNDLTPTMTDEQIRVRDQNIDAVNLPGPLLRESPLPVVGPASGTESYVGSSLPLAETVQPMGAPAAGAVIFSTYSTLPSSTFPTGASQTTEPAVGNDGQNVFYTGNWYAARSTQGGAPGTWNFINPYNDSNFTSFCCDQDVAFDPARHLMIWYRQGVRDGSGNNAVRIAASTNGMASYCYWDISPSQIGLSGNWFDYPQIAMSTNNLWVASNVYNNNALPSWVTTSMMTFSLDTLANCGSLGFSYFNTTDVFTFAPVQGAANIMYFAGHTTNSNVRIYNWAEGSGTINWNDVTVPAWSLTDRGTAVCTTPNTANPCGYIDHRMLSGWRANWQGQKALGFFWNVKQDDAPATINFPYPYTDAVVVKESDFTVLGRPYLWNGSAALVYATGAPNANGDLGISFMRAGATNNPTEVFGIYDSLNSTPPPGWEIHFGNASLAGPALPPAKQRWGDYFRVRPLHSSTNTTNTRWAATNYYLDATGATIPSFAIFGRDSQPVQWVTLAGNHAFFTSIMSAFVPPVYSGDVIAVKAASITGDVTHSVAVPVFFKGGYDDAFYSQTGFSTLKGKFTISSGSVTVDRVIISN